MEMKSKQLAKLEWALLIEVQRRFMCESIIFSLFHLVISFDTGNGPNSWGIFVLLSILSLIVLFVSKQGYSFFNTFYIVSVPLIVLYIILFTVPWWEFVIIFLFSLWRLKTILENLSEDYEEDGTLLLITVCSASVMYWIGFILNTPYRYIIIIMFMIQIFLFSLGVFMKRVVQSKMNISKSILTIGSLIICIPLIVAIIAVLLSNFIKRGISFVFDHFFEFFINLISPLLMFLIHFFSKRIGEFDRIVNNQSKLKELQVHKKIDIPTNTNHSNIFTVIFIIVAISLCVWFFFKLRRMTLGVENQNDLFEDKIINRKLKYPKKGYHPFQYYSKSSDQIRKSIFSLEQFASKLRRGRARYESLQEWLLRMNVSYSNEWISIYETVRYGNSEVTKKEMNQFMDELKQIKRQIREYSK